MNQSFRLAVVLIALLVGGCAGPGTLLDLEDPDSLAGTWHPVRWATDAAPFTLMCAPTLWIADIGMSGDYELIEGEESQRGLFVFLPESRRILFSPEGGVAKPEPLTILYLDAVKLVVGRASDGSQNVVLERAQ